MIAGALIACDTTRRIISARIAALEKLKSPMTTQNTWIPFSLTLLAGVKMPVAIAKIANGKIISTYTLHQPESMVADFDSYTHYFSLPKAPKPPESAEFLAGREAVLSELRALVGRYNSSTLLVGDMSEAEFIHAVAEMVK